MILTPSCLRALCVKFCLSGILPIRALIHAASSGYRMPAEWEPHEATWLGWPHELTDWPGKFAPIPWAFAEIVRQLARVERVYLARRKSRRGIARANPS